MNDGAINVSISVFVTLALAALALVLRLAARRSTKMDLGPDDMLAIVAFVGAGGYSTIILIWAFHWGLGQSLDDLTDENAMHDILTKSRLSLFIVELLYSFSISSSKLAILAFYWRLFKTSNIRVPILVFAGMSIIWLVVRIFLTIFHCIPIQAFWNKTMKGAKCAIDESRFFFGTVLVHCLIDIAILVLPIMPVRHLHLHSTQKVVVIALFAFGILVCIASIILLVESLKFNVHTKDMPHDIVMIIIWSTVEVNLAIVSTCLPILRPILRRLLPGPLASSRDHNQRIELPDRVIKLTMHARTREADETSSTHQLADLENRWPDSDTHIPTYTHSGDGLQDQQPVRTRPSCDYLPSGDGPY